MTPEPEATPLSPYEILDDPYSKRVLREAQTAPVRGMSRLTLRDEANAITVYAFRNGFIEDLHAENRITDPEMKRLNIQNSARLAHWLYIRDKCRTAVPRRYFKELAEQHRYTHHWDREALDAPVPESDYAPCSGCTRRVPIHAWRYCPMCGAAIAQP
jgi:hypothetical protein